MDGHWESLARAERQPLFSWIHAYEIMQLMESVCLDEASAQLLISRFGSTHSVTHASALCGALVGLSGRTDGATGLRLLLSFFDELRFRCHLPTMTTLLSKVNYLIQRDQIVIASQGSLLELCLSSIDMCEQMSREDWSVGRASDTIEIVELISEYGLTDDVLQTRDGLLLPQLIARAKAMNQTIEELKGTAFRETGDGRVD
jgi:hypothetical protein